MPTIEDLKYEIRDKVTLDKLYAIESIDVDADSYMLLQYLKNEYTQQEILKELQGYVESSIAFEDAEEAIGHLHQIVLDVETKVDLQDPSESMQSITLHEKDEDIAKYIPLGLNTEYDYDIQFSPRDLVMVGGKRGSGKSIVSCNIANSVYESGKTAIYFTIEMDSRSILQRCCSIATEVPFSRIRTKNLSITEWEKVATWWANRFLNGQEKLKQYREERNFDKFHTELKTNDQIKPNEHIDVIYDPSLTLAKIRAELDKKIKVGNVGIVIVDYINQVKRSAMPSRAGQYDWAEQIEVSKTLKAMAQEYETTIFSPYQTDASGEARFAKGILDAADAAYTINAWTQEDECVTLQCVKMRSAAEKSFTSTMDWETLKIGPGTALNPKEKEATSHATGEEINDI
jgi:replicative DNA helicase